MGSFFVNMPKISQKTHWPFLKKCKNSETLVLEYWTLRFFNKKIITKERNIFIYILYINK